MLRTDTLHMKQRVLYSSSCNDRIRPQVLQMVYSPTWMNWMVRALFPTPPPPTTTSLNLSSSPLILLLNLGLPGAKTFQGLDHPQLKPSRAEPKIQREALG